MRGDASETTVGEDVPVDVAQDQVFAQLLRAAELDHAAVLRGDDRRVRRAFQLDELQGWWVLGTLARGGSSNSGGRGCGARPGSGAGRRRRQVRSLVSGDGSGAGRSAARGRGGGARRT